MRIVAATRILNEDDVVEAFARHHATLVDHHVFLDNGSTDRTLDILRSLRGEGLALSVLQNRSVQFCEAIHNTFLHQIAVQAHGADWVPFLDADEFLDAPAAAISPGSALREGQRSTLREVLATVPDDAMALQLRLANYHTSPHDDPGELAVPLRMRRRAVTMPEVWKVIARGRGAPPGTTVADGNHEVLVGGTPAPGRRTEALRLAHFPARHPLQLITKAVLGRLKVLAGGQAAEQAGFSAHYTRFLDTMRDEPHVLLHDPAVMGHDAGIPLVEDPMAYAGGPLSLTRAEDPALRAVRFAVAAAEMLARRHGRLLDENAALRTQTRFWDSEFVRLV